MSNFEYIYRGKSISLTKFIFRTLTVMRKVIRKMFAFSSMPILMRQGRNRYLHGELKEFSDSIYAEQYLEGCSSDRKNMRTDVQHLRKSFKKAVSEASEEYSV